MEQSPPFRGTFIDINGGGIFTLVTTACQAVSNLKRFLSNCNNCFSLQSLHDQIISSIFLFPESAVFLSFILCYTKYNHILQINATLMVCTDHNLVLCFNMKLKPSEKLKEEYATYLKVCDYLCFLYQNHSSTDHFDAN